MKIIMTKDNIETIVISSILNEYENYEDLFQDINEDFFKNKLLKKLYSFLKENNFNTSSKKIESFLLNEGVESSKIKELLNYQHEYSTKEVKEFFLEVYKQRKIDETMSEITKTANAEEKIQKIKDLNEELERKISEKTLSDKEACITKYKNYITEAQEAFENNDGVIGISTGIPSLDEKIIGIKNAEYILVAARPSMGKTSLTTNFFIETIFDTKIEGVPVMFSLEMETEQIMGRIVAQMNDDLTLAHTIFGKDRINTHLSIEEILRVLNEKEFYIEDFSSEGGEQKLEVTPEDLDQKLSEIKKKHGKIKCIIIDYLQLMSPSNNRIIDQNARMTHISSKVKSLGRKYGCPVIALSQLNRDLEKRQDKRPQLSDLRESGALEQDADIIMFVYRPEVYLEKELKEKLKNKPNDTNIERQIKLINERPFSEAEIIIGKQRNGPTGIVNTFFHKSNARFGDLDDSEIFEDIYGPIDIYEEELE